MLWRARTRVNGLPVGGSDRVIDGKGRMDWRLFGLFPVMKASGPDITRSALDRFLAELIWLPSALAGPEVEWTAQDDTRIKAALPLGEGRTSLTLRIDEKGQPRHLRMQRWGNPDGGDFRSHAFGALFEEEKQFQRFTIPAKLRAGWFFGTDRFETEGEFFRCTIEDARYR